MAFAIVAVVQGVPVLAMVLAAGSGWEKAVVAALSAAVGMGSALAVWVRLGRPKTDRIFRDRPAVGLLLATIFVLGLIPTVLWAG